MSIRVGISVRSNAGAAARRVAAFPARLQQGVRDFTRDGTELMRSDVADLVTRRTSMSAAVADRITNSRMEGPNRGLVIFERPRPYTIRPKKKKALAWPGGRHPVGLVNHPGSRPWALMGRSANSSSLNAKLGGLLVDKARRALD